MKRIYFNNGTDLSLFQRFRKAVTRSVTSLMMSLFPTATTNLAERLLCVTMRSKRQLSLLNLTTKELNVHGHRVLVYRAGQFPRSVIFTHGWSGSSADFNAFYQPILDQGFNVITIDHVGHGQSSGKVSNMFLFMDALEQVVQFENTRCIEISAVIAHSMGGGAVINGLAQSLKSELGNVPVVLIAPVIPFFEFMRASIDKFGISTIWLDKLFERFVSRYGRPLHSINPKENLNGFHNSALIIHDRADRHVSFDVNRQYFDGRGKTIVHETYGLGHFKILAVPEVVQVAVDFVAKNTGVNTGVNTATVEVA